MAAFKAGSTPVHISEIKEDGTWISLRVKVIQLWDSTSDKITQSGLIGDETGVIKFTIWRTSGALPLEEGKSYEIKSAVTNFFNERYQVNLNKNTTIFHAKEDINVRQQKEEFIDAVVDIKSIRVKSTGYLPRSYPRHSLSQEMTNPRNETSYIKIPLSPKKISKYIQTSIFLQKPGGYG